MIDNIQEKVENKIIDYIVKECGQRITVTKPENAPNDLIVEKRGDYKSPGLRLRIFGRDSILKSQNFATGEIREEKDIYFLFAYFNDIKQDLEDNIWLVPVKDIEGKKEINIKDCQKFLMDKKDLGIFVISKLFGK